MECNAFNFYCDTVSVYLSYFEKKLLNSKEIPEGKETYVYQWREDPCGFLINSEKC